MRVALVDPRERAEQLDRPQPLTMLRIITIIWHFIHIRPIQAQDMLATDQVQQEPGHNYLPTHRQPEIKQFIILIMHYPHLQYLNLASTHWTI